MLLEVDTYGFGVLLDLVVPVEKGAMRRLPGGAVLRLSEVPPAVSPTPGKPTCITFHLECAPGVDTRLGGTWLYLTLKGKVEALRIAGTQIAVDQESIINCLEALRGQ